MILRTIILGMLTAAMSARGSELADASTLAGVAQFQTSLQAWSGEGFSKSVELLRKARDASPNSAAAHYWLGVAHFHRMLYQRHATPPDARAASESMECAVFCFQEALRRAPSDAESHALLGTLLGMKIDGVITALRLGPQVQSHQNEALRLGPDNPRVRYLLGSGLFHTADSTEKFRTALKTLQYAETLFIAETKRPAKPGEPRWGYSSCLTFIGRTHEALHQPVPALAAYQRALALHPGDHLARQAITRLSPPPAHRP